MSDYQAKLTGPEHFEMAEIHLEMALKEPSTQTAQYFLGIAQLHAQLATAQAIVAGRETLHRSEVDNHTADTYVPWGWNGIAR